MLTIDILEVLCGLYIFHPQPKAFYDYRSSFLSKALNSINAMICTYVWRGFRNGYNDSSNEDIRCLS